MQKKKNIFVNKTNNRNALKRPYLRFKAFLGFGGCFTRVSRLTGQGGRVRGVML